MKKYIPPQVGAEIKDVESEGLVSLLGSEVLLFGINYNYSGILIAVNQDFVIIDGAKMVFETGAFNAEKFKFAENMPTEQWRVRIEAIESYGPMPSRVIT